MWRDLDAAAFAKAAPIKTIGIFDRHTRRYVEDFCECPIGKRSVQVAQNNRSI